MVTAGGEVSSHGRPSDGSGNGALRPPRPKEPETFSGKATKLRVFVRRSRRWLESYGNLPESRKVDMLGEQLSGLAFKLFDQLLEDAAGALTVEQVLTELENKFADPDEARDARYLFQHLRQGAMTVLELSTTLDELSWTPGLDD